MTYNGRKTRTVKGNRFVYHSAHESRKKALTIAETDRDLKARESYRIFKIAGEYVIFVSWQDDA